MSQRFRIKVSVDFQLLSSFLNPHVLFMVMQVSQSSAGITLRRDVLLRRLGISLEPASEAVVHDDVRLERLHRVVDLLGALGGHIRGAYPTT